MFCEAYEYIGYYTKKVHAFGVYLGYCDLFSFLITTKLNHWAKLEREV